VEPLTQGEEEVVERYFIRRGLPHLIVDYRAATDVHTRAAPLLTVIFLGAALGGFSDHLTGWAQAGAFLLSTLIVGGTAVTLNRLRGRRALQLPDDIGPAELAAFVIVPAIPHALFSDLGWIQGLIVMGIQAAVLLLVTPVVSYGLVPLTLWAVRRAAGELTSLGNLSLRSLPLLLLFSTFLFLNAELWQVANGFTWPFFLIVIATLVLLGTAFIWFRVPVELDSIGRFTSWSAVAATLQASPDAPLGRTDLADGDIPPGGATRRDLSAVQRTNLTLVFVVALGVQIFAVSALIGAFYVGFGLFLVREETIRQWTTGLGAHDIWLRVDLLGGQLVLTRQLVMVAGFLFAFSGLQFAVSAVTDDTYRQAFLRSVIDELRQVLAVRAVYLARVELTAPATVPSDGARTAGGARAADG
jgi:hypothetical protein